MASQLFLVALLGIALVSATPVSQQAGSANFTSAMIQYLEAFRSIMPCGYSSDIPVLAPYTNSFYAFDYSNNDYNLKGNVSDIQIEGLNNFQILNASDYGTTGEASYDVIFSKIQILGSYEVEGYIKIAGFSVPIRQRDVINDTFVDLRFEGSYTFANSNTHSHSWGLSIVDFKQTIYLADMELDNWNTLWDVSTNELMNRLLSLGMQKLQPTITDQVYQNLLIPKINHMLYNVNMEQLVSYFQSQAQLWENADCKA